MYVCNCMYVFPVFPSVINATATLVTPNENRTLHSITVTCTINPDSTADMCEVRAIANDQTFISNEHGYGYICMCVWHVCTYRISSINTPGVLLFSYLKSKLYIPN